MKVLVVDDDATTRFVLRRLLTQRFACEVDEAADGEAALTALDRACHDLVLLDLLMPRADGIATLTAIRARPALASLPVVIMTVDRKEDMVRRVIELGICDFLTKPFNPGDVVERLGRVFEKIDADSASARKDFFRKRTA